MTSPEKPSLDVTLNKEYRQGKKSILLVRELGNTQAALNVLYQTEYEVEMSKDSDSEATKSGPIVMPGEIEYDFSLTCYMAVNDPAVVMLEQAFLKNKEIEIWEIDLQHKHDNKYAANYYHAFVTSFSKTASADEIVELELEFGVNGVHQDGWATVTDDQEQASQYEFKDTTATI